MSICVARRQYANFVALHRSTVSDGIVIQSAPRQKTFRGGVRQWPTIFGQPYSSGRFFDGPLSHRFVEMMSPVFAGPRAQADR
jgi:hypothetical protein